MTYKTEFPDFPDADIPPVFLAAPWRDQSWHNDACPSFARPLGDGKEVHVYVDYVDESARDICGEGRFCVSLTDDDGSYPADEERWFFVSDSLAAVLDQVGFLCGEVSR